MIHELPGGIATPKMQGAGGAGGGGGGSPQMSKQGAWGGLAGGLIGGVLDAMEQRQLRKDFTKARSRAAGTTQKLSESPILNALNKDILQDFNQAEGFSQEFRRGAASELRGGIGAQSAAQNRVLSEGLARRGLGGGSIEAAGRQSITRGALSELARGRQKLAEASELERNRKREAARRSALGINAARARAFQVGSQQLSAETQGLAALLRSASGGAGKAMGQAGAMLGQAYGGGGATAAAGG